jgi:hypothetical protein
MNDSCPMPYTGASLRWPVGFAILGLLFLISCTTVSSRVDRYESHYQQVYGPAEEAGKNPGVIHCEDEYVSMRLAMLDGANMDFQITNNTGGSITIHWLDVLYEVPKKGPMGAVPEGSDTSVIPAKGRLRNRFAPGQTVSLFSIDSEESGRSGNTYYSMDEIVIRMPIRMDEPGETKIYVFTYTYKPYTVDFFGVCNREN